VEPDWPTCHVESCTGIPVKFDTCLAHLEDGQLAEYLGRVGPGADVDVRGTTITEALLARLFDALSDNGGRRTFGAAQFEHARFPTAFSFEDSTFLGGARFDDAVFSGAVAFYGLDAREEISFVNAKFAKRVFFGSVSARLLDLDRARFAGPAEITAAADVVRCDLARFEDGVILRLERSDILARQTTFGEVSSIAGIAGKAGDIHLPRLLSLWSTDVSNLELVDLDLGWCEFAGARRLDQLRIAGRCEFNTPPTSRRWTQRQTLAEEHTWRGWRTEQGLVPVGPERVAALYRSLRKALEDSKNEAGAGDFYYGEMDARRHSRETRRTERWILWCYWLLSGYGQRAGRALIALLVLVATVTVLLTLWGQPAENAARIAVGAVVFRDDRTELTTAGEWTVLVARFLGPVLLALAVLAVRARVKR
jgi:hypothetical protein